MGHHGRKGMGQKHEAVVMFCPLRKQRNKCCFETQAQEMVLSTQGVALPSSCPLGDSKSPGWQWRWTTTVPKDVLEISLMRSQNLDLLNCFYSCFALKSGLAMLCCPDWSQTTILPQPPEHIIYTSKSITTSKCIWHKSWRLTAPLSKLIFNPRPIFWMWGKEAPWIRGTCSLACTHHTLLQAP